MPSTGNTGSAVNAYAVAMGSYKPSGRPGAEWKQSLVAVCATVGHGTEGVAASGSGTGGSHSLSATCPARKHVYATGFDLTPGGPNGQLLRQLQVNRTNVTATMDNVNLDSSGNLSLNVLCAAS